VLELDWPGERKGYGLISGILNGKRYVPAGRHMLAHRVSWIIHVEISRNPI
jgi:hypothetical protein